MRGNEELSRWGEKALQRRGGRGRRLRAHPRGARRGLRPRRARARDPTGCRRRALAPRHPRRGPSRAARRGPQRPTQRGERERAPPRRGQCRSARGIPRRRSADGRLLREADREQGSPAAARGAGRARRPRGGRRLRRLPRGARRPGPGRDVLFTGPLEHRHLVHLLALADAAVVPSIFPEAFGMVAAEAAAAGCPPIVADHSGLAEIAEGLRDHYPARLGHLASFPKGDAAALHARLEEQLGYRRPGARSFGPQRGRRPSTSGAGRVWPVGSSSSPEAAGRPTTPAAPSRAQEPVATSRRLG